MAGSGFVGCVPKRAEVRVTRFRRSAEAMQDKPKIKAQLREVREGAGRIWWESYVKSHSEDINRRFGLARAVYWTQAERMPLDLFSYIREAGLCFGVARFLATIVFSSTAVELVLNRDQRTRRNRELRRIGGWATLNNANLIIRGSRRFARPSSTI